MISVILEYLNTYKLFEYKDYYFVTLDGSTPMIKIVNMDLKSKIYNLNQIIQKDN